MKTKLIITTVILSGFTGGVALAGIPPQPSNKYTVNISSAIAINWQYQNIYGNCDASPDSGNQPQAIVKVSCPWTAQGQFNFYDGSGKYIGSVNQGYGPCRVINGNAQITATSGLGSCVITISSANVKSK